MRLFRKNNGAVSVFLVIILVPVLVVTSLFVDVSRMHLGQAVVDSAGDLALNTAMTQFDSQLNEYYGLLGTCKSKEELKELSKDFYEKALGSAGLTKEQSENMAKQMIGWFDKNPKEVNDLLNIKSVKDSFSLDTISNSGFNNPAIVKTQIVNFMKYRSPINGTLELLKGIQDIKEKTENSKEDAKLIDEKEDMCDAENDLLRQLNKLYDHITDYNKIIIKEVNNANISEVAGMKKVIAEVNANAGNFEELAKKAAINFLYLDTDVKNFNPKDNKYNIKMPEAKKGKTIQTTIDKLTKNMEEYDNVKDQLDRAIAINSGNNVRDTMIKAVKVPELYEKYVGLLNEMLNWYETLQSFDENTKKGQSQYENICRDYQEKIDAADVSGTGGKNTSYWKVHEGKVPGVGDKNAATVYAQERAKLNAEIEDQCTKIQVIRVALDEAVNQMEDAMKAINKIQKKSLLEGKDLLEEFQDKEKTWSDHIDTLKGKGKNTEIVQADDKMRDGSDRENNMDGYLINRLLELTESDFGKLKEHLSFIKTHMSDISSRIKQTKFGSSKIVDIKSSGSEDYVEVINKQWETKITEKQFEDSFDDINTLNGIVDSGFAQLYQNHINTISSDWCDKSNQKPDVRDDKVYKICKDIFENTNDGDGEEKYKKYDDKLDELEKKEETRVPNDDGLPDEYKPKEVNIKEGEKREAQDDTKITIKELPSTKDNSEEIHIKDGRKSKDFSKAADTMSNFFGSITDQLTKLATTLRDDLYSVDYITSMLSYDTFVNEGLYNTAESMGKDVSDLGKTLSAIRQTDVINAWTDEALTNKDNKTLTNKVISNKNNYAFSGEAEYILYGKSSLTANKGCCYGTIFAIRYAFNAVYGFKEYWSNAKLNSIAKGVFLASQGIIPPSLTKIAVILAIVMAESVYDLACLKVGMPVVIIKSKKTWHTQFGEVFDDLRDVKSSDSESITDVKLQYSDYLKIFLMVSLLQGNENKIYVRTADVIQCNMSKITEKPYELSAVKTWFTVSSKIEVTPLLLDMPWTRDYEGNPKDNVAWYTLSYARSNGYY